MKSLFFLLLFVVCIGKINAMRLLLRGLREDGLGGGKKGGGGWGGGVLIGLDWSIKVLVI